MDAKGILPTDLYNMDEKGFRIGVAGAQWVVSLDTDRPTYLASSQNRELVTDVECVSADGHLYAEMKKKVTAKNAGVRKAVTTMRKGICPELRHVLTFHPQEQISHPIPLGGEACLDLRERVFQVTTGEGRGPLNRQIFHG